MKLKLLFNDKRAVFDGEKVVPVKGPWPFAAGPINRMSRTDVAANAYAGLYHLFSACSPPPMMLYHPGRVYLYSRSPEHDRAIKSRFAKIFELAAAFSVDIYCVIFYGAVLAFICGNDGLRRLPKDLHAD